MFKSPRGTADILPDEQEYWDFVQNEAIRLSEIYGYQRIETPVFEDADLFSRTVGPDTDIVEKEMYTFPDRGGQMLALRPEGTAPVCRAYIQHGMFNYPQPVKLYYFCPVFRYERPQAGRYRQHHQFGLEVLGDRSASTDAEIIEFGWRFLDNLGLKDLSLVVNSIGDGECRPKYVTKLREFYQGKESQLCTDCRNRIERAPLRLLDCKRETCWPLTELAPRSMNHLCGSCEEHWQLLQNYLNLMKIHYRLDHRLVRGLDYYTRTVFEIQPPEEKGQSTMLAGGRYDGLLQELSGKAIPGMGFGTGLERLILNLKRQNVDIEQKAKKVVVFVYTSQDTLDRALVIAHQLRNSGVSAILAPSEKSLKAQMRYASTVDATYAAIIGQDELQKKTVCLKDMTTGNQEQVDEIKLFQKLK